MKRLATSLTVVILCLTACGQGASSSGTSGPEASLSWQEQYDLGVRYLTEGNYQEAIIAFTAAIEIDPNQALAYVGRGDAYIALGNKQQAIINYQVAVDLGDSQAIEKLTKLNNDELHDGPIPLEGYPKSERHESWVNGEDGYLIEDYNEFGNLIKRSFYLPNNMLVSYYDYFYDDQQILASIYNERILDGDSGSAIKSTTFLDTKGRCYREETNCDEFEETINYNYTDTKTVLLTVQRITHAGNWTDGEFYFSNLEFEMQSSEHIVLTGGVGAAGISAGGDTVLEERSVSISEYRIEDTINGGIMDTSLCLQEIQYSFDAQSRLIGTRQII